MTEVKPAACSRQTCEGCEIRSRLRSVHTPRDMAGFLVIFLVWAIPFYVGMVIGRFWIGLGVWAPGSRCSVLRSHLVEAIWHSELI